jgi:Leucine-rich repeat (LRR) protein
MATAKDGLYRQLTEAYSDANLNRITAALLDLYKSRQHRALRELARRISAIVPVDDARISKCFSQLVMLYHPDKGTAYRKEIESLARKSPKQLDRFSHILLLGDLHDLPREAPVAEDSEFASEYVWDPEEEVRRPMREWEEQTFEDEQFADSAEAYENTFFQAMKMKIYGSLDIEMPYYYLADLDDIEMSDSGIVTLDGIEHCTHANVIDISGNAITDLSDLQGLHRLEELYASRNQIGYVDALSSLTNLRIVDLSLNEIDDVSPLFELEHLELVNIVGNPVPAGQVKKLKAMRCAVLA